jgi:VCBS repeat-containing protein
VNDDPVAVEDNFVSDNLSVLSVPPRGVLANDTDVDGDFLTAVPFQGVSTLGAQVTVAASGAVTYNPLTSPELTGLGPGEVRIDTFTYTVTDGNGGEAVGTVRVFVSRNTGGSHVVEVFAGKITGNVNFGNRDAGAGGEWDDAIGAIAADVNSAAG